MASSPSGATRYHRVQGFVLHCILWSVGKTPGDADFAKKVIMDGIAFQQLALIHHSVYGFLSDGPAVI